VSLERVLAVYEGSDGDATKALYAELEQLGPLGVVAAFLLRAQKNSARAKVYRGRRYRGAAYDRKQWAMDELATALGTNAEICASGRILIGNQVKPTSEVPTWKWNGSVVSPTLTPDINCLGPEHRDPYGDQCNGCGLRSYLIDGEWSKAP
jgi:hypothetical protein